MPTMGSATNPVRLSPFRRVVAVKWSGKPVVVFELSGVNGLGLPNTATDGADSPFDQVIDKNLYLNDTFGGWEPENAILILDDYAYEVHQQLWSSNDSLHWTITDQDIVLPHWTACGILNFKNVDSIRLMAGRARDRSINPTTSGFTGSHPGLSNIFSNWASGYAQDYVLRAYSDGAEFILHNDSTISTTAMPLWTRSGSLNGIITGNDAGLLTEFVEAIDVDKSGNITPHTFQVYP